MLIEKRGHKMKKISCIIMMLCILVGCSTVKEPMGTLKEVHAKDALEMIKEKKDFVLVIGTTTCESCIRFEETLNEYIEDHPVTIYHLYIDNEPVSKNENGDVERTEFLQLCNELIEIEATPTVLWVSAGTLQHSMSGMITIEEFDRYMKQ